MNRLIFIITAIVQIIIYFIAIYYFILGLFGLFKRKEEKVKDPMRRFAIIVAAHNEELVIGKLIKSLLKQNYPRELFDIFIIADNCNDNTAKIARSLGVNVYERFNKEKIGKGYALEWMFYKIFKRSNKYDTIAIFDADNLVSADWIFEINSKMSNGYKVVQGYIDSKNPTDSWIALSYSIAFWTQNRLYQLARANLKLSNQIGGTGFAIDINTLKNVGWEAKCLTEDLEFSVKLLLNGEKVGWAHDAVIYDEKPLTLIESWRQRRRWMQGFSDVASRYFIQLLKLGIIKRQWVLLDCALYIIQPFITVVIGIGFLFNLLDIIMIHGLTIFSINYFLGDTIIKIIALSQLLITPLVLKIDKNISKGMFTVLILYTLSIFLIPKFLEGNEGLGILLIYNMLNYLFFFSFTYLFLGKENLKLFFRFILYGVYNLTWIPISIEGIVLKNNKEWFHTKHVRNIEICDI